MSNTINSPLLKAFLFLKTFRPKKKFEPGTLRYNLHKHADETLNAGKDLRETVKLPHDEELNDWIAVHVVDFFNRINFYGMVHVGSCYNNRVRRFGNNAIDIKRSF